MVQVVRLPRRQPRIYGVPSAPSIDNVNVEKGSGSKGLELPNSGELAVCIYFARRRSDRMRERSLRVSAQPYPNRYPRCRSAVMTRFTIIAIVALITTTAHAQGARSLLRTRRSSVLPQGARPWLCTARRATRHHCPRTPARCAASAQRCAAHCGGTTRTAFARATASDDARTDGTHTKRAQSPD